MLVGTLAWYSLIHLQPDEIDSVLAELRRVMAPGGVLQDGPSDNDLRTYQLTGNCDSVWLSVYRGSRHGRDIRYLCQLA